jgi:hypothetical protein
LQTRLKAQGCVGRRRPGGRRRNPVDIEVRCKVPFARLRDLLSTDRSCTGPISRWPWRLVPGLAPALEARGRLWA